MSSGRIPARPLRKTQGGGTVRHMSTNTYTVTLRAATAISGRTRKPANAATVRRLLIEEHGTAPALIDNVLATLKPGERTVVPTRYGYADLLAN